MKKSFLFSTLFCCIVHMAACSENENASDKTSDKQETNKVTNNDLNNFGFKGAVKSHTSVVNYTIYGPDKSVIQQKTDSIVTLYNQDGNMTGITSYNLDGSISFNSTHSEKKTGQWEVKTFTGNKQLISTTTVQRSEKSITEVTKEELSGAVSKKPQQLNSEFLVDKSETKRYNKAGNELMNTTEIYSYDDDKNKTKTTTEITTAKGEKNAFEINIATIEKDKYSNPIKATSKTVTPMGTMEATIKTTYVYY